jgi:hypothetical protein
VSTGTRTLRATGSAGTVSAGTVRARGAERDFAARAAPVAVELAPSCAAPEPQPAAASAASSPTSVVPISRRLNAAQH